MMSELLNIINTRRSVRTYDGRPLEPADREKLEQYMAGITNPFGVPVRFVLLDAEEHHLSSPVLAGETLYVAGLVDKVPQTDEAYGYSFEKLVLYAWSLGIGTVWIGGTMKREDFEQAAGVAEGERMPCISPLGYPAAKMSLRETMMRKGVGATSRMPLDRIFFEESFERPASAEALAALGNVAEMVRRAPSAVNEQPWRIVITPEGYHFYEKKDRGYVSDKTGDLQRIDVGIALCHFCMGMEEAGRKVQVKVQDPGLPVPDKVEYVATVTAEA